MNIAVRFVNWFIGDQDDAPVALSPQAQADRRMYDVFSHYLRAHIVRHDPRFMTTLSAPGLSYAAMFDLIDERYGQDVPRALLDKHAYVDLQGTLVAIETYGRDHIC